MDAFLLGIDCLTLHTVYLRDLVPGPLFRSPLSTAGIKTARPVPNYGLLRAPIGTACRRVLTLQAEPSHGTPPTLFMSLAAAWRRLWRMVSRDVIYDFTSHIS